MTDPSRPTDLIEALFPWTHALSYEEKRRFADELQELISRWRMTAGGADANHGYFRDAFEQPALPEDED
jgi:hypothetical protein